MANILLEIQALQVAYQGTGENALQPTDLSLENGQAIGLVGPSGSGKSTLLMAIPGLLPKQARIKGRICFQQVDLLGDQKRQRAVRWRDIAVVFQDAMNTLNPVITIGEQIADIWVYHERLRWSKALCRARGLLVDIGLEPDLLHAYPHELSGGMRQRVAIAMAVALQPALILVDEPTSALDSETADSIMTMLAQVRARTGAAMILSSHDQSVVTRSCDLEVRLEEGILKSSKGEQS